MANQKRNTTAFKRTRQELAALILERELVARENAVLARMLDKLAAARKAGSKMTFAAVLASA
jgi:hypothetical protein